MMIIRHAHAANMRRLPRTMILRFIGGTITEAYLFYHAERATLHYRRFGMPAMIEEPHKRAIWLMIMINNID